ncbi:MAG: hypothetical protein ACHQFW_08680 [Chitinophagales bacterium]
MRNTSGYIRKVISFQIKWCSLACAFLIVSCNNEPLPNENFNATENFNRTIKFDVIHVYNLSPVTDSAVSGATINIYSNYEDLLLDYYPNASRITDSLGKCEIQGLDKDKYYIRATHPAFSNLVDSVATPANTTSFVEMIFY